MAGTDTTEGQALWQPGGAEEDSHIGEGNRHLCLVYDEEEEEMKLLEGKYQFYQLTQEMKTFEGKYQSFFEPPPPLSPFVCSCVYVFA